MKMTDDKMCLWLVHRICAHPILYDLYSNTFKKVFCQYCLKGQEIAILTKI
jgi:hypothetical protein